jgi:hypothetical protein
MGSPSPPSSPALLPSPRKVLKPQSQKVIRQKGKDYNRQTIDDVKHKVYKPVVEQGAKPKYPFDFYVCDVVNGLRHLVELQAKCIPEKESFSKVFRGAHYARTTINKYRKIWNDTPEVVRDKYLSYGRQGQGLFSAFLDEVHPPKRRGTRKVEVILISDSDDESDNDLDKLTPPEQSDKSDDDKLTPPEDSALCPFCDEPLPNPLEPALKAELSSLMKKTIPDPCVYNPGHRKATTMMITVAFCHRHHIARTEAPKAQAQGWPTPNFECLPARIRELSEELMAVVEDPESSEFFVNARRSAKGKQTGPPGFGTFDNEGVG